MVRRTSSWGFLTGRRRRRIWSRRVKMAVFAPMPRARVRMAITVKPGVRARVRRAYLKSRNAVSSVAMVFISRGLSFQRELLSNDEYALWRELFPRDKFREPPGPSLSLLRLEKKEAAK